MPLPIILGPLLGAALSSFVGFVFRKVIIVFLITTSIYFLIEFLGPMVVRLATGYFGTNPASLLNTIPPTVWWFASAFKVDLGLKLMFSALGTRFLIRRIPFIG